MVKLPAIPLASSSTSCCHLRLEMGQEAEVNGLGEEGDVFHVKEVDGDAVKVSMF